MTVSRRAGNAESSGLAAADSASCALARNTGLAAGADVAAGATAGCGGVEIGFTTIGEYAIAIAKTRIASTDSTTALCAYGRRIGRWNADLAAGAAVVEIVGGVGLATIVDVMVAVIETGIAGVDADVRITSSGSSVRFRGALG